VIEWPCRNPDSDYSEHENTEDEWRGRVNRWCRNDEDRSRVPASSYGTRTKQATDWNLLQPRVREYSKPNRSKFEEECR
jgi:hypothetical protein